MHTIKKPLLLILALFVMLLVFSGCPANEEDNNEVSTPTSIYDISPTLAEWVVAFSGLGTKSPYFITAFWIGGLNPPGLSDTAQLFINNEEIDLISLVPGFWMGELSAVQGATVPVRFVYNGVVKTETTLKMVNLITDSDFPDNYNPAQSATFSWALPANNDHQVAGVTATKEISDEEEWSDDYMREIDVADRSFTVPANPINNVPAGAEYYLWISEVNFKVNNRTALMSTCTAQSGSRKQDLTAREIRDNALMIYKRLTDIQ